MDETGEYTLRTYELRNEPIVYRYQLYDVPPTSTRMIPARGVVTASIDVPGEIDKWRFTIDGSRTVAFDVHSIEGPGGPITATDSSWHDGQTLVLAFDPQPIGGEYSIVVGPEIRNPLDEALDQDRDGTDGESFDDRYTATSGPLTMTLNKRMTGRIVTPYSVERWEFFGVAGQQVEIDVVAATSPLTVFDLTGPNDWTGFEAVSDNSGLVTLSETGRYILTARCDGDQWRGTPDPILDS